MSLGKTICEVLKYNEDIEPFPLVKIYSGVGSGKSFFAARMVLGSREFEIPKKNILIITSRRAKVKETLKELGAAVSDRITRNGNLSRDIWNTGEERPWEYEEYLKEITYTTDMGEINCLTYNKSVVCTNAFVSAYLRYVHDPDDPVTHIWNKFDAIIVDEVHSLVADSTYQPATFDVASLIQEYLKLYKNNELQESACKHIILMTGTPEPFELLMDLEFPKELTREITLFDECKNVVPKNVIFIDKLTAQGRICELLSKKEKLIYFANRTLSEAEVRKKFMLSDTIDVGVSFSNEEKKRRLGNDEQKRIQAIEEGLSANGMIPDSIQLFVTTTRNKEGINIHNTDFHHMFVETHQMYDVVQMAGRVRSGVDNLYIVTNAEQFEYNHRMMDILFSKKVMVANKDYPDSEDQTNQYLIKELFTDDEKKTLSDADRKRCLRRYVKYIEDRFSYIRFHMFDQKFKFFDVKEKAEDMVNTQIRKFCEMILLKDEKYFKVWFPNSNVRYELSAKERGAVYLKSLLGKEKYVRLKKEDLKKHLAVIRNLFNSDLKTVTPILHLVDDMFNCVSSGNNYILYYGTEDPRVKKKPMKKRRKD